MATAQIKMGGKRTLSLFLKGNGDLSNSLLAIREGGHELEIGLQDRVRQIYQDTFDVRLSHESSGPSAILLDQLAGFSQEGLPRTSVEAKGYPTARETPSRLLKETPDVVVLSLEPDIVRPLWRHREHGYCFSPPPRWQEWTLPQQQGLMEEYQSLGLIPVERFRDDFVQLIKAIKERLEAHVIVYNCSTYDPGDYTWSYHGLEDTLSLRVYKFNLALIDISMEQGISIVDVDRLIAEIGAGQHVPKVLHYSREACGVICQEFLRVLKDIGFFEDRPLVMQIGQVGG